MQLVGLTGGIACGKSVVGRFLEAQGVPVCDTDTLAHEALKPQGAAYRPVLETFGQQVLNETGEIDRRLLGQRVFADSDERRRLESMVHPHVQRAWRDWAAGLSAPAAVVIVPLLFECTREQEWDCVISVAAPMHRQRQWLKQRGLTPVEIQCRLAAQMTLGEKMKRADVVLYNSGSLAVLDEQARRAWNALAMPTEEGCV